MKKAILLLLLLVSLGSFSQVITPVKWSTDVVKISNTEYELVATAEIEDHWHLYSQTVPEGGPIATSFTFKSNGKYLKKGNTKEEKGHVVFDKIFDLEIKYFDVKTSFKQRVKLKDNVPFVIEAVVEFMVCDDTRCLPPTEEELTFTLK